MTLGGWRRRRRPRIALCFLQRRCYPQKGAIPMISTDFFDRIPRSLANVARSRSDYLTISILLNLSARNAASSSTVREFVRFPDL